MNKEHETQPNPNVKIVDSFLDPNECKTLLSFAKSVLEWEKTGGAQDFWNNRSLSDEYIYNKLSKDIGKKLLGIKARIGTKIQELYQIEKVYPDILSIVRWFPGVGLTPHIDDMTDSNEESSSWFHHREFGIVIYLNDNFKGGQTYYPSHDLYIEPVAGRLVIHPGDENHRHGVIPSKDKVRYTISSFWTQDAEYHNDWLLKNES
jgi:hypothetical protein